MWNRLVATLALALILGGQGAIGQTVFGPLVSPWNGRTYTLLGQSDWFEAEAGAVGLGGHLATIRSTSENDWVHGTFASFDGTNRHLWIGLSDAASEGIFEWVSGEPVVFEHWADGEPNDFGGEDHVVILSPSTPRAGRWNDLDGTRDSDADPVFGVVESTPFVEVAIECFDPADVYCGTDPTCESALDEATGVTGFAIERFEDDVLEHGVLVMAEGGEEPVHFVDPKDIRSEFPNAIWDGEAAWLPTIRNSRDETWPLTIRFEPSTRAVGIGLGDLEFGAHLVVNDVSFGDVRLFPGYDSTNDARGVYVRLEARGVRPIREVRLVPLGPGEGDGVFIDHLAFDRTTCAADINADGDADIYDVLLFIGAMSDGLADADWTFDGVLDIFDVTAFVSDLESCGG